MLKGAYYKLKTQIEKSYNHVKVRGEVNFENISQGISLYPDIDDSYGTNLYNYR